jgi:hypothetical protein
MPFLYTPILKGKEGEYGALEELEPACKDVVLPLIEIPSVPFDYANDRPSKTLDDHISGVSDRINRAWTRRDFILDLPWFGQDENLQDGTVAVGRVLRQCAERHARPIPVVRGNSTAAYLRAVRDALPLCDQRFCVRMLESDFDEEGDDPADTVNRLVGAVGAPNVSRGTLILDLGDIGVDVSRATLSARSMLAQIPRPDEWSLVSLASASFPENLSEVMAATNSTLPRLERQLWDRLQRRRSEPIHPIFGDYAISHPVPSELDPRTMRMSASIRYTTADHWLIVKGRNVRQFGFDQYFELARDLVQMPEYSGEDFSWGDRMIMRCARREIGPGNATTWRKIGTNHHLTLVTRQLIASAHPVA